MSRRPFALAAIVAAGVCGISITTPANAQTIADRIAAVHDGAVRLSFPARPGVCGDDRGGWWTTRRGGSDYMRGRECLPGPVRVRLERESGRTTRVQIFVGHWRATDISDVDLGMVPALDAGKYLVAYASSRDARNESEALSGAAIADADVSHELVALVQNDDAPLQSRKDALFWTGQDDRVSTADLIQLGDHLRPSELREQFTFVLSQRRDDRAIDKLIDLAQHDPSPYTRKQAMFWLGQTDDPHAVKFFHDLLSR
jgi:hypothetical protein